MAGIRFFEMSFADANRLEATTEVTNNNQNVTSMINRDDFQHWESSGSNDSDTIDITCDFGRSRQIDSLLLTENNFKEFTFYRKDGGGSWVAIASETTNTDTTYFKKFTAVNTQEVKLSITKTMTADAEKSLRDFIVTKDLGQLEGYPKVRFDNLQNQKRKTMVNGKQKSVLSGFRREVTLQFRDHVGADDRAIVATLGEKTEPVLVWPCGGDASQFAYNDVGYRLKDIILANLDRGNSHEFTKNLYFSGLRTNLKFVEAA